MTNTSPYHQITALVRQGRFREAAPLMEGLVRQFPRQANYWHLYSVIAVALRQARKAVEFSQKAVALDGANPDYRVQLANARLHALDLAGALVAAAEVESLSGQSAPTSKKDSTLFPSISLTNTVGRYAAAWVTPKQAETMPPACMPVKRPTETGIPRCCGSMVLSKNTSKRWVR